ncbi:MULTISPECIES: hypothetical protein [unclassified Lactobacillus]|uniref:hypothetical protein n=2 Tax=Lactobacillus TaxID=1578 RepID=UPI0011C3EEA4|nr:MULTISPECIES: hypothetical protein [unclassified Lactobacillus]
MELFINIYIPKLLPTLTLKLRNCLLIIWLSLVAELTIIFDVIQFMAPIVSAFLASWIIALIFVVASFVPAILQGIIGPLIAKKSGKWGKTNSHYTETVTETGIGANIANNNIVSGLSLFTSSTS